jgi:hypothetical protein
MKSIEFPSKMEKMVAAGLVPPTIHFCPNIGWVFSVSAKLPYRSFAEDSPKLRRSMENHSAEQNVRFGCSLPAAARTFRFASLALNAGFCFTATSSSSILAIE